MNLHVNAETHAKDQRRRIRVVLTWQGHWIVPALFMLSVIALNTYVMFFALEVASAVLPLNTRLGPAAFGRWIWLFSGSIFASWAVGVLYVAARESENRPFVSVALYIASALLAAEVLWSLFHVATST